MNNVKWHGPARNPLAVALEVAKAHDCTSRLYATITQWELFEEKDFFDDLLREIAGATGIVVQQRPDGWYACVDTPDLQLRDPHAAEAPATRYYALLDTGDLAYVGDFESITEAFDHDPGNSVWMVSDDDVSQWISTVQAARSGTLPARVPTSGPSAQLSE